MREWQIDALAAWRANGNQGVIEAATGTGKTEVAIAAIAELHEIHGEALRVAVVVPSMKLARQWNERIERQLRLRPGLIAERHSASSYFGNKNNPIMIYVINTAREDLPRLMTAWRDDGQHIFLVVDECHHSGSIENGRIFDVTADSTMGLSATPHREDGWEAFIFQHLGRVVHEYRLAQALDRDELAPVVSLNFYVDFVATERERWDDLGKQIGAELESMYAQDETLAALDPGQLYRLLTRRSPDAHNEESNIPSLLSQRRQLWEGCDHRVGLLNQLLDWITECDAKAILFHQRIGESDRSYEGLKQRGVRVGRDHSKMRSSDRERELRWFREDRYRSFVAVRAMDEGVDVPAAEVAVIYTGTKTERQRIQRIGRILRAGDDKQAIVITILVRGTPEEAAVGGNDEMVVGVQRVRHHRWPATPLVKALPVRNQTALASTYAPARNLPLEAPSIDHPDMVRGLTIRELGLTMPTRRMTVRDKLLSEEIRQSIQEQFSKNAWYSFEEVRPAFRVSDSIFNEFWKKYVRIFGDPKWDQHYGIEVIQGIGVHRMAEKV